VAFKLEAFSWRVFGACLVVLVGVFFATEGMEIKCMRGVFYLIGAVFSLSIRWVLVHRMTKQFAALDLVYLTLPISALCIFPASGLLEFWPLLNSTGDELGPIKTARGATLLFCMLLLGSCLALFLMYFEYLLVRRTSSLTLCISGIGKEIMALVLSSVVFREHLNLKQWLAVGVSLVGIYTFSRVSNRVGKLPANRRSPEFRPVPTLSHLDIAPFE
jgi:drug/metabolite transporter (DMT)-like permease